MPKGILTYFWNIYYFKNLVRSDFTLKVPPKIMVHLCFSLPREKGKIIQKGSQKKRLIPSKLTFTIGCNKYTPVDQVTGALYSFWNLSFVKCKNEEDKISTAPQLLGLLHQIDDQWLNIFVINCLLKKAPFIRSL